MYRDEINSLQIQLSGTQTGPGRAVKEQQEQNSPNHVQRINLISVVGIGTGVQEKNTHHFRAISFLAQAPINMHAMNQRLEHQPISKIGKSTVIVASILGFKRAAKVPRDVRPFFARSFRVKSLARPRRPRPPSRSLFLFSLPRALSAPPASLPPLYVSRPLAARAADSPSVRGRALSGENGRRPDIRVELEQQFVRPSLFPLWTWRKNLRNFSFKLTVMRS